MICCTSMGTFWREIRPWITWSKTVWRRSVNGRRPPPLSEGDHSKAFKKIYISVPPRSKIANRNTKNATGNFFFCNSLLKIWKNVSVIFRTFRKKLLKKKMPLTKCHRDPQIANRKKLNHSIFSHFSQLLFHFRWHFFRWCLCFLLQRRNIFSRFSLDLSVVSTKLYVEAIRFATRGRSARRSELFCLSTIGIQEFSRTKRTHKINFEPITKLFLVFYIEIYVFKRLHINDMLFLYLSLNTLRSLLSIIRKCTVQSKLLVAISR